MQPYLALLLAVSLAQAEDRLSFKCPEGNYRLTYPNSWTPFKPPTDFFQLALRRGPDAVLVSGLETRATLEDVLELAEEEQKMRADSIKELSRKEIKLGGERALLVKLEVKQAGVRLMMSLTVCVHQGIVYRLIGVRGGPNVGMFNQDYESILDSFSFLADRKDWLAQFEGKPARTALLGGLASFELNRPRWRESTFDKNPEYAYLDQVSYDFFPGGASVQVRAREAKGNAARELEELGHELSTHLHNVRLANQTAPGRKGKVACLEITGEYGEQVYVFRAAVLVEDGLAVQLWLASQRSQAEVTRRDWEQFVRGFVLQRQSEPDEPPAFPYRTTYWTRPADPALAAFLPRATRVLDDTREHQVLGISPDGVRALTRSPDGTFVENLVTHKRERLALEPGLSGPVAWSRDGQRLAYATAEEVIVTTAAPRKVQRFKGGAAEIVFGPGDETLLVCSLEPGPPAPGPLVVSRLEQIQLRDGSRRVLVDFPLCRVTHPAVAPDGTRIALVTNRDYPRTAPLGGHLYLCAADGSGLRQLTREPEAISAVAWSADGKGLYVVRRLAVGADGAVGLGGSPDLYRVAPETGQAVNLTRSGRIGRAWGAGAELLVEVNAWDLPPSQRGIFRIAPGELEKATASRPVPPVADPRARARAVADRVRAAVGPTRLAELVPTPALLDKAARAFAAAVTASCGQTLDFSTESLDKLPGLVYELELGSGRDSAVLFGFGAYYGETLRRVAAAEWKLQPVPFGEWTPGADVRANALVDIVLPFSEPFRVALNADTDRLRSSQDVLHREQGQKLILVYPPAAAEALRQASGADYGEALKRLDAGDVKAALDLLARELQRRPKNGILAREVIAVCRAARLPDVAWELTRRAVDAGNEVPELLIAYGDRMVQKDPKKAFLYYRQAAQGNWPPAEAFLKLGREYSELGDTAVAEACWRRAYWRGATPAQRKQIRQWLGIPEPAGEPGAAAVPGETR
jgi:tetratricopeptide (TPR) repeat protein